MISEWNSEKKNNLMYNFNFSLFVKLYPIFSNTQQYFNCLYMFLEPLLAFYALYPTILFDWGIIYFLTTNTVKLILFYSLRICIESDNFKCISSSSYAASTMFFFRVYFIPFQSFKFISQLQLLHRWVSKCFFIFSETNVHHYTLLYYYYWNNFINNI